MTTTLAIISWYGVRFISGTAWHSISNIWERPFTYSGVVMCMNDQPVYCIEECYLGWLES